jgi:hypothetical protein
MKRKICNPNPEKKRLSHIKEQIQNKDLKKEEELVEKELKIIPDSK